LHTLLFCGMNGSKPHEGTRKMQTFIDYFRRVAHYDWWVVAIELFLIGVVIYWAIDFLEEPAAKGCSVGFVAAVCGCSHTQSHFGRYRFERWSISIRVFLSACLYCGGAFQPEIRRALMRLGQPTFLIGNSRQVIRLWRK